MLENVAFVLNMFESVEGFSILLLNLYTGNPELKCRVGPKTVQW